MGIHGLALFSALPQTRGVCLTQQPPTHREVSRCTGTENDIKAEGSRSLEMGTVPVALPGSVQQHCACKPDAMLWVTCPSGSLPDVPRDVGQSRIRHRGQRCRAFAMRAEQRKLSVPECTGRLQMTLAEPAASGSQPRRMCSRGRMPAALPSQAGEKLPNAPPQECVP